jgi:hypothetical protein
LAEVVTELVIDARGAEAGSAVYIRAMRAAQSAVDRVLNANEKAQQSIAGNGPVMVQASTSIGRVATAWNRLAAAVDPAIAAQKKIEQATLQADAAIQRGITTRVEAARVLGLLQQKLAAGASGASPTGPSVADREIKAYNQLRASVDEVARAQMRYTEAVEITNKAVAQGVVSQVEAAQTLAMVHQRLFPQQQPGKPQPQGMSPFEMQLLQFQAQDIVMSLATGQNFSQVALQQGSQIVQMQKAGTTMKEFGQNLMTGVMTFITNPLNQALLIFTLVTTAAIKFFETLNLGGRSLADSMKGANDLLSQMHQRFGSLIKDVQDLHREGESSFRFTGGRSQAELTLALRREGRNTLMDMGIPSTSGYYPIQGENVKLLQPIRELQAGFFKGGTPDIAKFREEISKIALSNESDAGLQKFVQHLMDITKEGLSAQQILEKLLGTLKVITPRQFEAAADAGLAARRSLVETEISRQNVRAGIDRASIYAKSPTELGDIARRQVLSETGGDVATRDNRARIAGDQAEAQALEQLAEAERDRARSAKESREGVQVDIAGIGRTSGEIDTLKANYQAYADLRREAEQNHVAFDQAQFERLKRENEERGKAIDLQGRLNMQHDIERERAQISMSENEARIVERLKDLYPDATDAAKSYLAAQMRINDELKQFHDEAKDLFSGLLTDFRKGDFLGGLNNALTKISDNLTKKLTDDISTSLANGLTSSLEGSLKGDAGMGGWMGDLIRSGLGISTPATGTSAAAAPPFYKIPLPVTIVGASGETLPGLSSPGIIPSIGSIAKTLSPSGAASLVPIPREKPVLVGGMAPSGAPLAFPGSDVTMAPIGTNATRIRTGFPGAGISMPMPGMGALSATGGMVPGVGAVTAGGNSVQAQVWNFWASKGLSPQQISGIMGNVAVESKFNPDITGTTGDKAYGLYQFTNDRKQGLFNFAGTEHPSVLQQNQFAYQQGLTSERGPFGRLLSASDVRSSTIAWMGFERPKNFRLGGDPNIVAGAADRFANAQAAFDQMAPSIEKVANVAATAVPQITNVGSGIGTVAAQAAQAVPGLGSFGSSIGQLVSQLGQGLGGGGSGGGIGGLFGSLFGGAGNFFTPGVGTRAGGGPVERGHPYVVGEKRPELFVPEQSGRIEPGVPGAVSIEVHNYSKAHVETEETTDDKGNRQVSFIVDDQIADLMRRPGSRTNRALSKRGAPQPLVGRA